MSHHPIGTPPCEDVCTAVVIFGITGDLARRKTFIALYELLALPEWEDIRIIGVGRSPWSDSHLRRTVGAAVRRALGSGNVDRKRLRRLQDNLTYLQGDPARTSTMQRLTHLVEGDDKVLCYLAVPPVAFEPIIDGLAASGIPGLRLLVEKPFGHDLASSLHLAEKIGRSFPNEAVYAVDHYLEKRAVERIAELRFSNRIIEGSWNSEHIDEITITLSEDVGIEGRAGFFDEIGTLRDVVQNHAMQVLTAVAMEPPASDHPGDEHQARLELVRSVQPVRSPDLVRGQYDGYLDIDGVPAGSRTETFVRVELTIDNRRWAGTRFCIIAGKALDRAVTEAAARYRPVSPAAARDDASMTTDVNVVRFGIAPQDQVMLTMHPGNVPITIPGSPSAGDGDRNEPPLSAYARVLDDARRGDHRRFVQQELIAATWRIFDDVIHADLPLEVYPQGSAGPVEALTADASQDHRRDHRRDQREAETTPAW